VEEYSKYEELKFLGELLDVLNYFLSLGKRDRESRQKLELIMKVLPPARELKQSIKSYYNHKDVRYLKKCLIFALGFDSLQVSVGNPGALPLGVQRPQLCHNEEAGYPFRQILLQESRWRKHPRDQRSQQLL
jgi:hypothetical protein